MTVVDLLAEQAAINQDCLRLAVFEGKYRWHQHPDSDELFIVVTGTLQTDFADGSQATLTEWQSLVVRKGSVHRTHGESHLRKAGRANRLRGCALPWFIRAGLRQALCHTPALNWSDADGNLPGVGPGPLRSASAPCGAATAWPRQARKFAS